MAHHLEFPIARQDVRLDITDLYLFRGETGTAFAINVCHSIAGEIPSPGYHPEGMYEFKANLNGDAVEGLTDRITFDERDPAGKQRFVWRRITGADAVDPHAPGTVVTQGTTGETATASSGLRLWAERGVQSSEGTVRPSSEHRKGCLDRILPPFSPGFSPTTVLGLPVRSVRTFSSDLLHPPDATTVCPVGSANRYELLGDA